MKKNSGENAILLTRQEVAIMLNVSPKAIMNWTTARRMPGQIKIGRVWRYRRTDVEKALLKGRFLMDDFIGQTRNKNTTYKRNLH